MKKIIIIGLTGSGKTVLAQKISSLLDIPVYYLDLLFWNKKGHLKDDEFTNEQKKIFEKDLWIIDGGFPRSKSLELRIRNADTIIFYDLPLHVVFWRQWKRYVKYWNTIRPDFGKKQVFPFSIKDIMYAIKYPTKDIYAKIQQYGTGKSVFIISNNKDQKELLRNIGM